MRSPEYSPAARRFLLGQARASIAHGIEHGLPAPLSESFPHAEIAEPRACFVTLRRFGELRGCTGSMEAEHPLAHSVVLSAFQTAFEDPRFPPLAHHELDSVDIEISVLSPLEPLSVANEAELMDQLEPLVDGLLLEAGALRSTFLPKVWEQLPDPRDFLAQLKRKAGLPGDYWSASVRAYRYHTETFAEEETVSAQ